MIHYLFTDKDNASTTFLQMSLDVLFQQRLSLGFYPSFLIPCPLSFVSFCHSFPYHLSFILCPLSHVPHPSSLVPRPLYHFYRLSSLILILCLWSLILSLVPHPFKLVPFPLFLSLVLLVICPSHLIHRPLSPAFGPF